MIFAWVRLLSFACPLFRKFLLLSKQSHRVILKKRNRFVQGVWTCCGMTEPSWPMCLTIGSGVSLLLLKSMALRGMGEVVSLWGVAQPPVDDVAAFLDGSGRHASELKCHPHYYSSGMFAGDALAPFGAIAAAIPPHGHPRSAHLVLLIGLLQTGKDWDCSRLQMKLARS